MNNEQTLLASRLKVCDFILVETGLFLDTHPTNQEALAHYKKHNEMYQQTKAEYTKKFGPIMQTDYSGGNRWNWVDGPWPWQAQKED